jgi:uncharacterized damage-inducible protein DinB
MNGHLAGDFARILDRDLASLASQLERYPDEASVWRLGGGIKNSAGTLALHLVGNLEHFVGAVLGGSGYVRDRDAEFGDRDVPRAEVLRRIAHCREVVAATLGDLDDEALRAPYPGDLPPIYEGGTTTHLFLLHLAAHFMWHLGQVDYHRRLLA